MPHKHDVSKNASNMEAKQNERAENVADDCVTDSETIAEAFKNITKDELIDIVIRQEAAINDGQKKQDELTLLCKRVQADFDNYRKRNNENLRNIRQDAAMEIVEKFLPTIDIVDQALTFIKDEQIASGIKMMRRQLMDVFSSCGVVEIEACGAEFDPRFHEAVMSEDDSSKCGKVIGVMRNGYMMGDKVLRYAAVKVAK